MCSALARKIKEQGSLANLGTKCEGALRPSQGRVREGAGPLPK